MRSNKYIGIQLVHHIDTHIDLRPFAAILVDPHDLAGEEFPSVHQPGNDQVVLHRDPADAGVADVDADGEFVHFVVGLAAQGELHPGAKVWEDILDSHAVAGAGDEDVEHEYLLPEGHDVRSPVAVEQGHEFGVQLNDSGFHNFNIVR